MLALLEGRTANGQPTRCDYRSAEHKEGRWEDRPVCPWTQIDGTLHGADVMAKQNEYGRADGADFFGLQDSPVDLMSSEDSVNQHPPGSLSLCCFCVHVCSHAYIHTVLSPVE